MFSYSVINTAAPGSLNPTHHNQHRHLQVSSYSDVVSDHHHRTNLVPRMAAQDAQLYDDHVPIESIITFISSSGNTTMDKHLPGSAARVTTRKKCDKRSKIRTSQGLRDRRVRLSIETARKFFDLQDLLGFDKPSRTVEWLLTKSNKAILELTGASASSTTSSSEQAEGTEDYCFKSLCSSRSTATCSTNQVQHVSSDDSLKTMKLKEALLTSRESRERARARARARTFAKLCTSKLHHHQEIRLAEYCQNFSSPSSLWKSTSHAERQEELKRKEEEQRSPKQKQHLQLRHSYFPNPNLSEDHWDHISSVIDPLPSSSATNILNLSTTDVEMYTRSSWDQLLLHHYRTL